MVRMMAKWWLNGRISLTLTNAKCSMMANVNGLVMIDLWRYLKRWLGNGLVGYWLAKAIKMG